MDSQAGEYSLECSLDRMPPAGVLQIGFDQDRPVTELPDAVTGLLQH
jgi:hypothetical protein